MTKYTETENWLVGVESEGRRELGKALLAGMQFSVGLSKGHAMTKKGALPSMVQFITMYFM